HSATSDKATVNLVTAGPVHLQAAVQLNATATTSSSSRATLTVPEVTIRDDRVDVTFQRTQWDVATISAGATIGATLARIPRAFVGGLGFFFWGRWRWRRRTIR